mmetsp:Transcript_7659/g.23330  ORF Transcript_7659/g.23330 Transcript_7659/m.23330 type:complete len:216 (-) Transcript_7659:188-835(-)
MVEREALLEVLAAAEAESDVEEPEGEEGSGGGAEVEYVGDDGVVPPRGSVVGVSSSSFVVVGGVERHEADEDVEEAAEGPESGDDRAARRRAELELDDADREAEDQAVGAQRDVDRGSRLSGPARHERVQARAVRRPQAQRGDDRDRRDCDEERQDRPAVDDVLLQRRHRLGIETRGLARGQRGALRRTRALLRLCLTLRFVLLVPCQPRRQRAA